MTPRTRAAVAVTLIALSMGMLSSCASDPEPATEETASVAVAPQQVRSFMIDGTASVSSDSGFETTTLTIDVTKLDNSVEGSMGVTILFGEVRCDSRRPYLVYQGSGDSAKLFQGDRGTHDLKCTPFTPASEFAALPPGVVQ